MTNHPLCPKEDCLAVVPHPHPTLGDGLFGPRPQEQLRIPEHASSASRIDAVVAHMMVPCKCVCGTRFQGVAFMPLRSGEEARLRTCAESLDKREAEALKRTEQIPKPARVTYRDAEPLNRGGCYDE